MTSREFAAIILGICVGVTFAYETSSAISSDKLSLADANSALSASGGLAGKVFAVGDNRYVVRRSRLTGKKGNVFIGEIEIEPLPKHVGGAR